MKTAYCFIWFSVNVALKVYRKYINERRYLQSIMYYEKDQDIQCLMFNIYEDSAVHAYH